MGIAGIDILKPDTETVVTEKTEEGDHDIFAHIVNPQRNTHIWEAGMSMQDVVDFARKYGWWVVALCGKRWVPKRNPDLYPACPTCMEIAGDLMKGAGE